jgi:hypothetical protein
VHKYRRENNVYYVDMDTSLIQENNTVKMEEIVETEEDSTTVNLYPVIRHAFLTLCILLAVAIILFLIYQNGKSIYDKGI